MLKLLAAELLMQYTNFRRHPLETSVHSRLGGIRENRRDSGVFRKTVPGDRVGCLLKFRMVGP